MARHRGREHLASQPPRVERVGGPRQRDGDRGAPRRSRRSWARDTTPARRKARRDAAYAELLATITRSASMTVRRGDDRRTTIRRTLSRRADARARGWARRRSRSAHRPSRRGRREQSAERPACVLSPEMTEGPYYLPGEKLRRNITEGQPGAPLAPAADRARRNDLQARQGRGRRHLARQRRRRLLRRGSQRHGRTHLSARHPAHRRERPRALQDRVPGLVPGPRRAHPRQGARRRQRRAHRPALLPRRFHGRRLPARPLQGAWAPDVRNAARLDLRLAAAAAR